MPGKAFLALQIMLVNAQFDLPKPT